VRRSHRHSPRPQQRSGRVAPPSGPSPLPAAVAARARCPARNYSLQGWETCHRHRPRPPQRAGAGGTRVVARTGPRGPPYYAAPCGSPGRRSGHQEDGSPDCIAIEGKGSGSPDVGGGGSVGAGAALVSSPRAQYTVWARDPPGPELRATTLAGRWTRIANSDHGSPGVLTLPRCAWVWVATGPDSDARGSPRYRRGCHHAGSRTRVLLWGPGHGLFKLGRSADRPETISGGRRDDRSPGPLGSVSRAVGGGTDRPVASANRRPGRTGRRTHGPTGQGLGLHLRLSLEQEGRGRAAPGLQQGTPSIKVLF
jgi:hypothetical protein